MLTYYPALIDPEAAKTLVPESTFRPLGYAGDPANFRNINRRALDSVEVDTVV